MAKRLNEIQRTATFAWSPGQQIPLIAAGTVAGALDDSFSNASELELFRLDLTSSKSDGNISHQGLSPVAKVNCASRFNTLAWGYTTIEKPHGLIAGGMENGELALWDPSAILDNKGDEASLVLRNSTHTGTIRGIDFNVFQSNLLATAGSNSEVYIWDLAKPDKPYTPGSRSMNMDDITSVGWNGQVSHILATSSTSGHTVVWDLRNRKEVMTLAYSGQSGGGISAGNRRGITTLAWHPDVATQLVTGAEDDNNPIITLWDLRHAHSPEKTLAGHQKGILGVSWCRQDSDLLLSCGKDSRTLCWNPQSGELLGQVSQNTNWTFQADWCPRNPDLFASASFDGQINVFSIQGSGDNQPIDNQPKSLHADDPFSAAMLSAVPQTPSFALKHPPKWLRRPVGASFSFGGKLVCFNNKAGQAAALAASTLPPGTTPAPQAVARNITITNVITEPEIAKQADELETAMEYKNLQQLIDERQAQSSKNQDERDSWQVLRTLYDDAARDQLLVHLGFSKDDIIAAVNKLTIGKTTTNNVVSPVPTSEVETSGAFENNKDGVSDLFSGGNGNNDFFGNSTGQQPSNGISPATLLPTVNKQPLELYPSSSSDIDRLVTRAVVLGDFESAVNVCLATERWSDALMFAICGGDDLLSRTRLVYFQKQSSSLPYLRLLESVVNHDLESIVRYSDLKEWDSVIAVLCTFAGSEDFATLSEILGARLEDAWAISKDINKGREYRRQATLCYLAAGNLEKVAGIWIVEQEEQEQGEDEKSRGASLQHFVEKVTVFRNAIGFEDTHLNDVGATHYPLGPLYSKYCQYAELLATQGKLSTALKYLNLTPANYQSSSSMLPIIRDRVYRACGSLNGANLYPEPVFPFELTPLVSERDLVTSAPVSAVGSQVPQYGGITSNTNYQSSYAPPQPSSITANQPPTSYAPVTNPLGGPNVYQPQPQQPTVPSPYGNVQTNQYGSTYNQPSTGYNNYGYGSSTYGSTYESNQQPSTAPLPPPPMAGPPRQSSTTSSPSRTGTPVNVKNTTGAWNDPPMLANPNMTKSPRTSASVAGPTKRVTSPFPNMPASTAFVPTPQQSYMQSGPQGNMAMGPPQGIAPPPQASAPPRAPPPPMNAMAPIPQAKQFPPPPPQQQQQQPPQQQQQGMYNPSVQQVRPPPMGAPVPSTAPGPMRSPQPPIAQGPYVPPSVNNSFAPGPFSQQQQQPQSNRPPPPQQQPLQQQQQQQPYQPYQPQQQQQSLPQQPQQPFGQAPPPRSVPPSGPAVQQSPSPAPAKPAVVVPEKKRHPKDDRSHISAQQRPIFDILSNELQRQRQQSTPAQKKMLDDTEKRLNALFDNMNNDELSDDVAESMLKLAQAIQGRDYSGAHRLQVGLVTTKYGECGAWLVGVKRLIDHAQQTM
ncbi:uncharacterized protein BX664DRAFT_326670 [Halteromyces radiatus]|uniref:uncharacterized protein n=1 Tax=Halteromyces radiatus TaxID=101107 RepID=UPI00222076D7|nr:uncharacterized protein BX664DRAFT_326670 [Halteromyces radiatus]KAI8097551.1 hypothetical protein BX664DRAFT_326670 [Halteromyces radiatus]